jgi:hydroxyacylglutathione hydrolase
MTLELLTIPCRSDNYAFVLHDAFTGQTAVVDVPDHTPILAALKKRDWTLSHILITHHHDDHIGGVDPLRTATGARVFGAAADAHRLPQLDQSLRDGDTLPFGAEMIRVLDVPGHTLGHIAFHLPTSRYAFTADSLMAAGCGRLFEGTPLQMHASLAKLSLLPPETLICSGHEYTASNLRFAASVDPTNAALQDRIADTTAARAANRPTVPSRLSLELATNPFLRANTPALRETCQMPNATAAEVFAELRARKDRF